MGMGVLLATSDYDPDLELSAVEAFLGQRVDGLVITVCDPENSPALALLDAEGKPYVLLYNQPTRGERPAVSVDNVAAAKAMTSAMIAQGHRRIAFVAGRFASSDRSRLRYQGFVQALAERGLTASAPIEVDFLAEKPDAALAPTFCTRRAPTALFCSNDIVALAAIAALRRLGLEVPGDVSVTGFDGIAIGTMMHPSLTTVRQPTRLMGISAMRLLGDRIAGRAIAPVTFVDYELRQGGTLAHAPTQRRGDKSRRQGEGTPP
jgi:DNA-binding LacI/PurR family transcriptional regulator